MAAGAAGLTPAGGMANPGIAAVQHSPGAGSATLNGEEYMMHHGFFANILAASDKFKGSLTARQACECIRRGLKKSLPRARVTLAPMADGGDGTLDVLVPATGGTYVSRRVTGPMGNMVAARYGVLGNSRTALVEMAQASGLMFVPAGRGNPLKATTYGTGELIRDALDRGYREIIVAIGGSATVDGGMGMAQALGVSFLDSRGKPLGRGGSRLSRVRKIDVSGIHARVKDTQFIIAADANNSLLGPNGAARMYGPQKGATPAMVRELERGMGNYASVIKSQLGMDIRNLPGAGAAGGLGAGLAVFCGARMTSGAGLVMERLRLDALVRRSDLVITGEGRVDRQTLYGKVVMGVIRLARKHRVPVVCFAGSVAPGAEALYGKGVIGLFGITPSPETLEEAMRDAGKNLVSAAFNFGMILKSLQGGRA